eukprot:TRINITY_DN4806_c0_g1_i1.p1 TRINITY_DN4806_c0_g1~~TRINITY_DN4806_c0_g1_i1.p1  ORF type:complete len:423 (-),score=94.73 TRINITY_DN4806_c0_g1_i1:228-1496(-)
MALAAVNARICSLKEKVRLNEEVMAQSGPPHPEDVRQLQALKEKIKEAEKDRLVKLAELHSKYYSFGQVSWITRCMEYLAAKYPEQPLVGMQLYDKLFTKWLTHHWGSSVKFPQLNVEILEQVASNIQMDICAPQSLEDILQLLHAYEELHLETEQSAGFSSKELAKFSRIFNRYDKKGDGLQARTLWAVLSEMGIHMNTAIEQNWLIDVVKYLDKDRSGTFDFQEFCQLLRKVEMRYQAEERERESKLILGSSIDLEEVDGWYDVFHANDSKGQGQLTVSQVYKLIETVGVKLDFESKETFTQWIKEVDTNSNGVVEFGEFVVMMSRIVKENLCGINKEAAEAAKKEVTGDMHTEAGTSHHGDRWSKLSIDIDHQQSLRDHTSTEEMLEEPSSPKSRAAVEKLDAALRDSAALGVSEVAGA